MSVPSNLQYRHAAVSQDQGHEASTTGIADWFDRELAAPIDQDDTRAHWLMAAA